MRFRMAGVLALCGNASPYSLVLVEWPTYEAD